MIPTFRRHLTLFLYILMSYSIRHICIKLYKAPLSFFPHLYTHLLHGFLPSQIPPSVYCQYNIESQTTHSVIIVPPANSVNSFQ